VATNTQGIKSNDLFSPHAAETGKEHPGNVLPKRKFTLSQ